MKSCRKHRESVRTYIHPPSHPILWDPFCTYIHPPSHPILWGPFWLTAQTQAKWPKSMHDDPNLARKPIFWAKVHGFGLIDLDSGFWYPNSGFGHPHLDLTNPDLCLWDQDSDLLDLDYGLETQILTPGTHILASKAQILTSETQMLDSWDPDTVEPRSNGPAFNGIPPITDVNSLSLQSVFFYFLYWL